MFDGNWALWTLSIGALVLLTYLTRVNQLLSQTPAEVCKLSGPRWTPQQLKSTYRRLQNNPIDYSDKLPPRLERRYIVTGGSGLVGGFIVQQLLARGTPTDHIRILDIRRPELNDVKEVEFVQTDVTSRLSVDEAFAMPWPFDAAELPLTVFHTAAVILASERSASRYGFPEAVNVGGTRNVLSAARAFGADIFSATSSGSISIRPVRPFALPFVSREKNNFWQVLDERDFADPLRPREGYFGNYPASKAVAERIVCEADEDGFRTGCIRPANGVYGNPTDNTVGDPLSRDVLPTWVPHIVQSFVHGANVAIAHLHHEAALLLLESPSSGRPFVVTDPNPPITYGDLYTAIRMLSVHPFATIRVPPVAILVLAHAVELYDDLPQRLPSLLSKMLPQLRGDLKLLKPGIFSICTHLVASDADARKPISRGGIGYEGVLTTLEGMVLEVLEWNREHSGSEWNGNGNSTGNVIARKAYTTSVSLADKIQKRLGVVGNASVAVG
ncbi:hypothetical protein F5X99DRAFT_400506 [Biscogniauxia marginata]|nr:hypothetical protein F5X99DRAFT_400506 [Biscogniauxia marginata]